MARFSQHFLRLLAAGARPQDLGRGLGAASDYKARIRLLLERQPSLVSRAGLALGSLALAPIRQARRGWLAWRFRPSKTRVVFAEHGRFTPRGAVARAGERLRATLYIADLGPGGSERQLCTLARQLVARGHQVDVLTIHPPVGLQGHYRPWLEEAGIIPRQAGDDSPSLFTAAHHEMVRAHAAIIEALPPYLRAPVLDLLGELLLRPPQALHCWLDYPNIFGGLAGLMAGMPRIMLGARSLSLPNFPHVHQGWAQFWWGLLTDHPQVRLTNNSRRGAEDYAVWLGLDPARIAVIRNGVDPLAFAHPGHEQAVALRRELGIDERAPLLLGVFRLAPEKRPLDFLRVAAELSEKVPGLRTLLIGEGQMQKDVETAIKQWRLGETVRLVGRKDDMARILAAADLLLLCSQVEGTPNVLLEAQALGLPVVATRTGGIPETVLDGLTGFLCPVGGVTEMTACAAGLLGDRDLRRRMGLAGREMVRERFSLERMVDETLALYAD
jgi:glycosyltransferase involved in cell wall biosynthesis